MSVPYSILFRSSHKKITRQTLQNGEHIFRISYPRASQRTKNGYSIIRELHSGRTIILSDYNFSKNELTRLAPEYHTISNLYTPFSNLFSDGSVKSSYLCSRE